MSERLEQLRRDLTRCEDMIVYAQQAIEFMGGRSLTELKSDKLIQFGVVRCVEVIGEAARYVSDDTRLLAPGIPWPIVVGMRHVLAHAYGIVDLTRVHSVVATHLKPLIAELEVLVNAIRLAIPTT